MTENIIFSKAYPVFGELTSDGTTMTWLLQLNDGTWIFWNGCDFERQDAETAMELALEEFNFSPLAHFIYLPKNLEIDESLAVDLLWIDSNDNVVIIQRNGGRFLIDAVDFASRDEAVRHAVDHIMPREIYAANIELIERYPQAEIALKDW